MTLPKTRVTAPELDLSNPLHWAKWQSAGRPDPATFRPSVQQALVNGSYMDEPPPLEVTTWTHYEPGNPDHERRAVISNVVDPAGTNWKPILTYHLENGAYRLQLCPNPLE